MFNFIYPYIPAYADTGSDNIEEAPGGVLLEPLLGLISSIGEGVIWVIQSQLLGMNTSNIHVTNDGNFWGNVIKTAGTVIAGVAVGAALFVPGLNVGVATAIGIGGAALGGVTFLGGDAFEKNFPDDFYLPIYKISPQEIFSDQIPILHINFLNPKDYDEENDGSSGALPVYNSAKVLGPQVAKWYVAIRNFVLVGLMVVLLYIGIRIVISSTANEKAKYKEHIKDWLVAVILVVFMHYIMAFALTLTEYLTNILNTKNEYIAVKIPEESISDVADALGDDADKYKAADGNYYYYTNLMGYARLQQQMLSRDNAGNVQFSWNYIGYTIIYLVLVIYTVMFLVIYLKRVIYMAFLTMIAPLVALTYPIDKLSDGKAQAFDMWLKEYIYNLLLQPFHLVLYTLLIGSVMDLAANNMLYAIVALGFLMPAEKLLRRFFGFDKAPETGSIMGGVVGGSMAMHAINRLGKLGSGSGKSNSGKGSGKGEDENSDKNTKIRTADQGTKSNDELFISGFGGGNSSTSKDEKAIPAGQKQDKQDDNNNSTVRMSDQRPEYVQGEFDFPEEEPEYTQGEFDFPDEESDQPVDDNSQIRFVDQTSTTDEGKPEDGNEESTTTIRFVDQTPGPTTNEGEVEVGSGGTTTITLTGQTPAVESNENRPEEDNKGNNSRIRFANQISTTGKAAAKTALHYTGKGLKAAAQKAPKLIAKGALGAAVGTVGVAAGVASGDWSNVAAYGAAAATVGAQLGNAATNVVSKSASALKGVRDEYRKQRYTNDEIKKMQNDKLDEEWRKDKDVIKMYQEKFGKENYTQAMDDAMEYRRQGITDDKVIIAAQKLKGLSSDAGIPEEQINRASQERVALAKAATMVKSDSDMKSFNERLENNGISKDKIKEVGKNIRKINKM